jgi:hypothetical protein
MEYYEVANYVWNFSCKRDKGSIPASTATADKRFPVGWSEIY